MLAQGCPVAWVKIVLAGWDKNVLNRSRCHEGYVPVLGGWWHGVQKLHAPEQAKGEDCRTGRGSCVSSKFSPSYHRYFLALYSGLVKCVRAKGYYSHT
mmetsp:Transcript_137329/g.238858  ORF Transcript_137329/g.238858 Transcript_137329/m.238858 type:complete len:98 (-) Transcript_137329:572-865(-)